MSTLLKSRELRPGPSSVCLEQKYVMAAPWEGSQCQQPWSGQPVWLSETFKSLPLA